MYLLFTKGAIFQEGGPIGLVQNGDLITIDVVKRAIDVDLTEAQLEERRRKWSPPSYKATCGALWKVLCLEHCLSYCGICSNRWLYTEYGSSSVSCFST